jgi:hypothetical protein
VVALLLVVGFWVSPLPSLLSLSSPLPSSPSSPLPLSLSLPLSSSSSLCSLWSSSPLSSSSSMPLSQSSFCSSPARRCLPESVVASWPERVGTGWLVVFVMCLDWCGGATLTLLSARTHSALYKSLCQYKKRQRKRKRKKKKEKGNTKEKTTKKERKQKTKQKKGRKGV